MYMYIQYTYHMDKYIYIYLVNQDFIKYVYNQKYIYIYMYMYCTVYL